MKHFKVLVYENEKWIEKQHIHATDIVMAEEYGRRLYPGIAFELIELSFAVFLKQ